jgi:hypothetical protein
MYDKDFKRFEELAERTKEMYEFWLNCITTTLKDFYKLGK